MNIYTSWKISVLYASSNVWLFTYNAGMYSARQLEVAASVYDASLSKRGETKRDCTVKIASETRDVALRVIIIAILWTEHKRSNLLHVEFCLAWSKFMVSFLLQTFRGIQVIYCMLPVVLTDQMYEFVSSFWCDISLFDFGQNLHSITSLLLRDRFLNDKQTLVSSLTPSNNCTVN